MKKISVLLSLDVSVLLLPQPPECGSQHFRLMQEVISIVGMVAGDLGTRSKAVVMTFYLQELNSEHKEEDLQNSVYFIFSVAIDSFYGAEFLGEVWLLLREKK